MKPIRYGEEAEEELHVAARWYEAREDGLGYRFIASIKATEAAIEGAPEAWQIVPSTKSRVPPPRRKVIDGFPYLVVYLILDTDIRVIAIAHTKRRPGYWRRRLRV